MIIDQTTQSILTVGMPTLAVLIGMLVNNSRLFDLRSYIESRFASVDSRFASLEKVIDTRFEAAHQELLRVEGVLDARLSHLEDRR